MLHQLSDCSTIPLGRDAIADDPVRGCMCATHAPLEKTSSSTVQQTLQVQTGSSTRLAVLGLEVGSRAELWSELRARLWLDQAEWMRAASLSWLPEGVMGSAEGGCAAR